MDTLPSLLPASLAAYWERFSLPAKCAGIALLVLILQLPVMMVHGLRNERSQRRDAAVAEIGRTWGGPQTLVGPVLVVPFTFRPAQGDGVRVAWAYFMPERLDVTGDLATERRSRGIYTAVVYTGRLALSGRFAAPDWTALGVNPIEIRWAEARLIVAVSDPKGIREAPEWTWCGRPVAWTAGTGWDSLRAGLRAPVAVKQTVPMDFSIPLTLAGSRLFALVPAGARTTVSLSSPWPDPGFEGATFPASRTVGASGFRAHWVVNFLGRDLPQQWAEGTYEPYPRKGDILAAALGVNLAPAVDSYRTLDRALKHSLLFLALVFTAFFTFEMTGTGRLKMLHYLLVGASLCLFYLGLLALSEFVGFGLAYALSAAASTLLITGYSASVLGTWSRAGIAAGATGGVYGYLYFVLQMQDYALLAGTLALFVALAAIMAVTRRWERLHESP